MIVLIIAYAYFLTKHNKNSFSIPDNRASAQEVRHFAENLDRYFPNSTVAFLIYEHYNILIINYYRIMSGLPAISFGKTQIYHNDCWDNLWTPWNMTASGRSNVRQCLKTLNHVDYLIIPEFYEVYSKSANPYALYAYYDELVKFLNAPKSPKYVVKMVLHDAGNQRLLILQRIKSKDALTASYDPFVLPYKENKSYPEVTYRNAMTDKL